MNLVGEGSSCKVKLWVLRVQSSGKEDQLLAASVAAPGHLKPTQYVCQGWVTASDWGTFLFRFKYIMLFEGLMSDLCKNSRVLWKIPQQHTVTKSSSIKCQVCYKAYSLFYEKTLIQGWGAAGLWIVRAPWHWGQRRGVWKPLGQEVHKW